VADSVTLRLDGGTVSFRTFATATDRFAKLLAELPKEAGVSGPVEWVLSDLELGSAILAASPLTAPETTTRLVDVYLDLAGRVRANPFVLDRPALRLVSQLAEVSKELGDSVAFETEDGEVIFRPAETGAQPVPVTPPVTHGTVTGRIQTLQLRRGLRFVLYDALHDKAVVCYLAPEHEGLMRDAWGRLAEVTGMVTRDPVTDRPRTVRQVTNVRVLDELDRYAFRAARGVVERRDDAPPSEDVIRRIRDAG
jgi:hypothetical protein